MKQYYCKLLDGKESSESLSRFLEAVNNIKPRWLRKFQGCEEVEDLPGILALNWTSEDGTIFRSYFSLHIIDCMVHGLECVAAEIAFKEAKEVHLGN